MPERDSPLLHDATVLHKQLLLVLLLLLLLLFMLIVRRRSAALCTYTAAALSVTEPLPLRAGPRDSSNVVRQWYLSFLCQFSQLSDLFLAQCFQ
jgi:hypothetical protein